MPIYHNVDSPYRSADQSLVRHRNGSSDPADWGILDALVAKNRAKNNVFTSLDHQFNILRGFQWAAADSLLSLRRHGCCYNLVLLVHPDHYFRMLL